MYVYAFLPTPQQTLDLPPGIAGPLEVVCCDRLAALVEPDLEFGAIEADDTQLLQAAVTHDRVMCHVFDRTPLLPLKFATRFYSREAISRHLQEHQQTYLDKLDALDNYVEFCCKLTPRERPLPVQSPASGRGSDDTLALKRRYELRVERQRQQEAEKQLMLQRIAESYPQSVFSNTPSEKVERAYVLVPRQQMLDLQERAIRWRSQLCHWRLDLGEPLPPYHFV